MPESIARTPSNTPRRTRLRRWLKRYRVVLTVVMLAALFTAHGRLVSYQAWRKALRNQGFIDEMVAPSSGERLLIFSPHPDDEVLGCGGLVQEALANGAKVEVALMTNGDASELSLVFGEKELIVSPPAMIELGCTRQEESLQALSKLGLSRSRAHFLSYPNNGLITLWRTAHWRHHDRYVSPYTHVSLSPYRRSLTPQAPYCGQQVLSDVVAILQQVRPNKVFVTHPKDVHPDHWATNCFVRYALATIAARGGDWADSVEVYGYLVHWPHYPAPSKVSLKTDLLPPADLASEHARWLRLPLSADSTRRKLEAISTYRSQLPSYDRLLLTFARANETFELLPAVRIPPGVPERWGDRGNVRRALRGVEIRGVELTLLDRFQVNAKLRTQDGKVGKGSYLGLDLRSWDEHGAPAILEVTLGKGGDIQASRITGAARQDARGSVTVSRRDHGYSVKLAAEPGLEPRRRFFLTCWGSARDRTVDSAVVSPIQVGASPN